MIDGYTEPVAAGELVPRAGGEGEGGGVALLSGGTDRVVGDDPLVVPKHHRPLGGVRVGVDILVRHVLYL